MSLILEALKKSEDKRRLGAAPDLATPFSAPRRRSWVWPIAVLLVVAGLVAWALRPSSPPPPAATTAATPKAGAPELHAAPTAGQKTGVPLHSVTGNNDLVQTAPPPVASKPPVRPAGGQFVPGQPDANTPPAPETRSGREIFEAMRKQGAERAQSKPQNMAPAARTPTPPQKANANVAATSPARVAAPPPPVVPAPVAAAPSVAAPVTAPPPVPAATGAAPPKSDAAAATDAPSRAPKSSATVGLTPPPAPATTTAKTTPGSSAQPYSELPFSVRKSLPELKLSMHVYAADPTHRFVVLNDSRLTEGEKTGDDIFVREIRPDGVVLEFQNQRFFFPRDGL
jgi:general secretion pathway protein B